MSVATAIRPKEREAFINVCVNDSLSSTPYSRTELLRAVTALVHWSTRHGVVLDWEHVFARDNIVEHVARGLTDYGQATRTNRRSELLRVAEALLEPALAPRALPALAAADPIAPYSSDEEAQLLDWARQEKRARRGDDAVVLLALGFGAGLSAQEVMNVRSGEVEQGDVAVLVHVLDGRVRSVPVLRRWEKAIARRAAALKPDDYLFRPGRSGGGKNLISNFVARTSDCGVHAQTQRMRSTWLVTHMSACTPLPELVEAAGVDSLEALTRYLRFVPGKPSTEARSRLRAA